MKKHFLSIIAALVPLCAVADDGMWLPNLISARIADMQAKGFRLSAEDIYSVNQASLKDAVVLFGRGCTGELISSEGLLITNHHCGYGQIQSHSSVEHDYLRDGFWAMTRAEELPCPGLSVSFLERMDDVSPQVLRGYEAGMDERQRDSVVRSNSARLIEEATAEGKGLRASVEAMYYGNIYYIFIYREYTDIRLVGAPPSSIGKFGGDTDNWMWPRHTGDFSMFRVYAGEDNMPAGYSPENRPYSPKRFFSISTKGVQEGDFTFIYGFPGSTREYIHSSEVEYISEVSDPARIDIRTRRLEIQKRHMAASQKVRIQYSAKCASVANAWKKWQGEVKGVRKMNTVQKKREYERDFERWAAGSSYEGVTERIAALERELRPYAFARDIYSETAYAVELPKKNLVLKDYDIRGGDGGLPQIRPGGNAAAVVQGAPGGLRQHRGLVRSYVQKRGRKGNGHGIRGEDPGMVSFGDTAADCKTQLGNGAGIQDLYARPDGIRKGQGFLPGCEPHPQGGIRQGMRLLTCRRDLVQTRFYPQGRDGKGQSGHLRLQHTPDTARHLCPRRI